MARGPSSYPALHYAASTSNLAAVVLDFAEQDPDSLLQSALNASQSPELKSLLTRNSRNEVDAWYRSAVLHLSDASHLPTTYEAGDMRRHFFETQFARMGVSTLSSYLDAVAKMDPIPLASQIKPPVLLVTNAPPTPFSQTLLDSFSTSDKMLLVLQQSHGETVGREGSVRNVSYWLKEVLARGGEGAERVVRVAASA